MSGGEINLTYSFHVIEDSSLHQNETIFVLIVDYYDSYIKKHMQRQISVIVYSLKKIKSVNYILI